MKTLKHIRKITQGKKTQQQQERESLLFETKWDFFLIKRLEQSIIAVSRATFLPY